MKKIVLLIFLLLLVGCKETPKKVTIKNEIEEIKIEEVVIPTIDKITLDQMIKECNELTNIIELDTLHDMMIDDLLAQVDLERDLELQSDIIENIILDKLDTWRLNIVRTVVEGTGIAVHEDDIETIAMRTTVSDAYYIMLAYEKIFLRKYNQ